MDDNMDTLKNNKENIREYSNISESGKVKKFLGVYYEWGIYSKGTYEKTTLDKDTNKLV